MREDAAWLSRGRPAGHTLPIAFTSCGRCGRAMYMTLIQREWGKNYCRGCDEEQGQCYCPSTREVRA